MKKASKFVTIALSVLMIVALLAACGNTTSSAPPASAAPSTGGTSTPVDAEGPVMPELPNNTLSIDVRSPNFGTDAQTTTMQGLWQEAMEEYLGIKLDLSYQYIPWSDYREQEKVLIQAGDIPDVATYSQDTYINEFGADGMVLNIMDYWDYLTYYPEYANSTNGGLDFILTEDGASYYFFDGYYNPDDITGAQSFTSVSYRFDILKEHDLTPAVTLDEFTQLCADIQALIDDGSIDAKYVMSNTDKNFAFYRGFVGIFHTWDTTYWNGTEFSFGPIEDNFREMLRYVNGLYEAGYIDPEFSTDESAIATEKALNGGFVLAPCGWAGNPRTWNTQKTDETMEWGLAFLPENPDYGTPWKWGSRQPGKSVQSRFGIIINAETEYPEWICKMIDYQYSDEMVHMMNWGVEGETYTVENGVNTYTAMITDAEAPMQAAADFGIPAGGGSRPGIPFHPQDFNADASLDKQEPWWNADEGYYMGSYWVQTGLIGGPDSVSPFDRPPVLRLSDSEATMRAEMTTACELYAKEQGLKFITGDLDIDDDAVWESYIAGVKSQTPDFDGIFATMNSKYVK